jgi:vesicle-associated membrane protein 7
VAVAYGMNTDFSRVLQKQMEFFSTDPSADRLSAVSATVDEVKSIMVHNIEQVLERGDRIELLVDKTETLSQRSTQFRKSATTLKRTMWWKNVKLLAIIGVVLLVLLYFIICMICGGLAWQGCIKHKPTSEN